MTKLEKLKKDLKTHQDTASAVSRWWFRKGENILIAEIKEEEAKVHAVGVMVDILGPRLGEINRARLIGAIKFLATGSYRL